VADTPKTHRGVVVRAFRDADSGQTYEKDAAVTLDAGLFDNLLRAGLVRKPDPKAADKPA